MAKTIAKSSKLKNFFERKFTKYLLNIVSKNYSYNKFSFII